MTGKHVDTDRPLIVVDVAYRGYVLEWAWGTRKRPPHWARCACG